MNSVYKETDPTFGKGKADVLLFRNNTSIVKQAFLTQVKKCKSEILYPIKIDKGIIQERAKVHNVYDPRPQTDHHVSMVFIKKWPQVQNTNFEYLANVKAIQFRPQTFFFEFLRT